MIGYKLVLKSRDVPDEALDIIRHHHERLDGRGYPDRLLGEEVKLHVRIAAIADVYDAITSDRCYQRGRSPDEALKILRRAGPGGFGESLVEEFIRCVGIFPVGSLVELGDGAWLS